MPGATSVYGTQGVATAANVPGARDSAVGWIDNSGNLWLFGGEDPIGGGPPVLDDLWEFNPTTKLWTWMGGNGSYSPGIYGTRGIVSSSNFPGSRESATGWTDHNGNFWLFGGYGTGGGTEQGILNDLWEFNPSTRQWTWVSGSQYVDPTGGLETGVYGTQGVPSPNNVPEGTQAAVSWIDNNGDLWFFGGQGLSGATVQRVDRNDLWKFNPTTNEWTWMGGINPIACTGPIIGGYPGICGPAGVYGTQGVPAASNLPSSRMNAAGWIDSSGSLWLFGGLNIDTSGTYNELNDLWRYQP